MAATDGKPAVFSVIWERALRDFYRNTDIDLANDPDVFHPRSVDDLIGHLNDEHSEFGHDTKSSQFTHVIKGAIGPFSFLTSTVGSTAASMFPGGSQVLAAFGVLINAGAAVTRSFDAVGGLFEKLGSFTGRLSEVSHETIPDALVPIYQAMLVSLLNICSLATRMTWKSMKDVKPGESRFLRKMKKIVRPAFANIDEYMKQLLMGGNGEVSGAVGSLKTLVENESLMMQAIVVRKATHVEAITVNIEGLTVQMSKAVYDLQADTAEVKFKVTLLNQSVDRIESGQKELQSGQKELAMTAQATYDTTSEMRTESAKASKQLSTQLETIQKNLDEWRKTSGSSKQQDASAKTKSAVHGESKSLKNLESSLDVKTTRQTNVATYGRVHGERIKGTADWLLKESAFEKWSQCKVPLLLVTGEAGYGKTFLASRAIDYIAETHKTNVPGADRGLAYFFFRKGQNEDEYISSALKTMAFAIAQGDQVYAKYLNDAVERDLLSPPNVPAPGAEDAEKDAASGATKQHDSAEDGEGGTNPMEDKEGKVAVGTSEVNDKDLKSAEDVKAASLGATDVTTADYKSKAVIDASTTTDEDNADQAFARKLTRVNSAVLDRVSLKDEEEERAVRSVVRHWNLLFNDYFRGTTRRIYLVLDGLDECDETDTMALCAAINASSKDRDGKGPSTVHVMLLMNSTKVKRFGDESFDAAAIVPVNAQRNMADLDRYVDIRMAAAWSKKLVRRDLYNDVHNAILGDCDGNFLKASLIVDEVTSLPREDVIRSTIKDLPQTLETAMLLVINRLSRQLDEHEQQDLHASSRLHRMKDDVLAWVACAKRSLSLAEIDALLTIRQPGGARVVDLERRLRTAYVTLFSVTGDGRVESSAAEELSQKRLAAYDLAHVGIVNTKVDPLDHTAPKSAVENKSPSSPTSNDAAIRRAVAAMQRSYVALSHSLIAEQIQKRTAQAGLKNFTTDSMQGMVLLGCLEAICGTSGKHDKQTAELAGRYCGPYLSDHLTSIEPGDVEPATRSRIAKLLIRLFRETECMTRLVGFAEGVLSDDFFKKALFRTRSMQFMQDPDVQKTLDDGERQWVQEANGNTAKAILGEMAQAVARRWLTQVTGFYEDYFLALRTYWAMVSDADQAQPTIKDDDESLKAATTEEVVSVAEWTGLEKNGRWYARIAVTLRYLERYDDSTKHFQKAIELDPEDGIIQSGLALTHASQQKWADAVRESASGITKLIKNIEDARPSPDPSLPLSSYLMGNRQDYASWSLMLDRVDEAIESYEAVLKDFEAADSEGDDWNELLSIVVAYFYTLCERKRWDTAGKLIERICQHPCRHQETFLTIYQYLTVFDYLSRIGYTTKRLDALLLFVDNAIHALARYASDDETSWAVYCRAVLLLRLDPNRVEEGIRLMEAISESDDTNRGMKDVVERELARYYISRSLRAREMDQWHEVGTYASLLVKLVISELDVDGKPNFGTRDCGHILAAWDRVNGRLDRAKECVRQHVIYSIDLLSDTDPDNDDLAWIHLMDAYLAIQQPNLAVATQLMPRQGRFPKAAAPDTATAEATAENTMEGASKDGSETVENANSTEVPPTPAVNGESDATNQDATALAIREKAGSSLPKAEATSANTTIVQGGPPSATVPADPAEATAKNDEPAAGWPFCSCDGCCFESIPNDAALWRCSFCIAEFCVSCHELIKSNKMEGWNICGSSHDHVYFPAMTVTEKYPENTIKIDGKDVLVKDWVAGLREEWNYPKA